MLKTLAIGPAHGHTIAHAIAQRSEEVLQVEHGVLGNFREQPPGAYYRPTPKGRAQLVEQTSRWDEIVRAINRILRPAD